MKDKKRLLIVSVVLTILVVFATYVWKGDNKMDLTEEEQNLVQIATDKAMSLGYKPDELRILYDRENKKWNEHWDVTLASEEEMSLVDEYKNLASRDFQAIHFYPKKKYTFGGSVWILIDKGSKKVIFVQREK
jgi:hypothetical protein